MTDAATPHGAAALEVLLERVAAGGVVELSPEELARLLEAAERVAEEDTRLAGPIRVLALGDRILVQEAAERDAILVRAVEDVDAARRFVDRRLAAYERMWDG